MVLLKSITILLTITQATEELTDTLVQVQRTCPMSEASRQAPWSFPAE